MKLIACIPAVVLISLGFAADKGKVTIENVLSLRNVAAPRWSPDGKWLAFTVSDWNKKENRRDTHIHIVPAAGGDAVRLTNGERGETEPRWSPDSKRIAFLASRKTGRPTEGAAEPAVATPPNQVWSIAVTGGEAEKITDEEAAVTQFAWSPDSRHIAYVVRDTPADKAERDKRKKDKFDAVVVDTDFTYSHLWTIDTASKQKKRVTEGTLTISDPQWSPDRQTIAYVVSNSGAQESAYVDISDDRTTDIFATSANGGPARRLTANGGVDAQPRWSPDGKWIAYTASTDRQPWAAKVELHVIPAQGGEPRSLTSTHGDSVSGPPQWSPDGRNLYVNGQVGVYSQLWRVSANGGALKTVFEKSGTFTEIDLSPDGKTLAFASANADSPSEIWTASSSGTAARQLTDFNPEVKNWVLGSTDVIRWKGADGLDVEGILVKPVGYQSGTRYPTILQIHGGPYGRFAYGFLDRAHIYAGEGYAVLMPNPRGSTGYGHKFTTANLRDWGGNDFKDLMAGVDQVVKLGVADPERLAVMGGSYGGFMTFWTITQTNRFKAAIGHAAISDWYSFHGQSDIPGLMEFGFGGTPASASETYQRWSPVRFADRVRTPILITHGEQDKRVPIAQSEQFYRTLRKLGATAVFVRYPREGHGIQEPNHVMDLLNRQLQWLAKYLKPAAESRLSAD
jgi:dipeptidyl aminopeptidase/acylaminoacyl peptidase